MGDTTLGQYIPRNSWLHNRDPRARLTAFLFLFLAITFSPRIFGLGLGLIIVLSMYLFSKLPFKPAWSSITQVLPFIIVLAVLQIIFMQKTGESEIITTIFGIIITRRTLICAVMMVFRFIVLIAFLNVIVMSISTSQITTALFYLLKPLEKIGFPVNDLTMTVQITLRYVPLVAQIAEKTAKAQAARGADWEQGGFNPIKQAKMVLPLIVPIFITSLKRAETMAVAMESRGFNAAERRSSFYELSFTWQDTVFILATFGLSMLVVLSGQIF